MDGKSATDINELRTYLAKFKWDDEARFRILRNAQEKEIVLKFKQPENPPVEPKK